MSSKPTPLGPVVCLRKRNGSLVPLTDQDTAFVEIRSPDLKTVLMVAGYNPATGGLKVFDGDATDQVIRYRQLFGDVPFPKKTYRTTADQLFIKK